MHKVRCAAAELVTQEPVSHVVLRIYEMMMQYHARLSGVQVLESLLHDCMSRTCSSSELGDGLRESAIRTDGCEGYILGYIHVSPLRLQAADD